MDHDRLHAFVHTMLGDLGAAGSVPLVRIGDRLGFYKVLNERGATTADELAAAAGCHPRYVREWLSQQAASGYVAYDAASDRFSLPEEQAMVFAVEDSPVYMMGAFDLMAAMVADTDRVAEAFRTGEGLGYEARGCCLFCAIARFFRTAYNADLIATWLPAIDGMRDKLTRGAKVADIGCGHGLPTIMMAEAFPNSRFVGYDFDAGSIAAANDHAAAHGVSDRVRFEVANATGYAEDGFDLVVFFDALHDLGDPVGAARHARTALKPDGTLMLVEPAAGDALADNLNPVGRMYYAGSTMICVPTSLAQQGRAALGAQAGPARLTKVLNEAGFGAVRCAAATPFNMVIEARV